MATQIARDGFARATLMRETVHMNPWRNSECDWCGQERKRLFRYHWEQDSIYSRKGNSVNVPSASKLFCSIDCYRTYTA